MTYTTLERSGVVILTLSDLHLPYQHKQTLKFLSKIKETYKPDQVIICGDELDYHSLTFHVKEPELMNITGELKAAKRYLQGIVELFPKCVVLESNHGSLAYRQAKVAGIPACFLKTYSELLETPKTWTWKTEHIIKDCGKEILFHHGISSRALMAAKERGCCLVQGHYHSKMSIEYYGDSSNLKWAMQLPCLIDETSLAFAYGKNNREKQKLGVGVIIDGYPHLIPMR